MTEKKNNNKKEAPKKEGPKDKKPGKGLPGELPGMASADTPLGKECRKYRCKVDEIKRCEGDLECIETDILKAMKAEDKRVLRIEHNGEKFLFERTDIPGKEKLLCRKESKGFFKKKK